MNDPAQPLGESRPWLDALDHLSRVAPLQRPVLVVGERGTGKELAAERLHSLSRRWDGPYVTVNCAALPGTLLDSELFGHERGAFTGATERREGRFAQADGGTLLLDELATASLPVQEKLLRVTEYGTFQRVGGSETLEADVRIIGATNADLPRMAERGRFRADLLDRLAFDVITLPPLRVRDGDPVLLARHFARRSAIEMAEDFPGFSEGALALIASHPWPGNVRELRNAVQRAVFKALAEGRTAPVELTEADLDPFASPWRPGGPSAAPPAAAPSSPARAAAGPLDTPAPSLSLSLPDAVAALERRRIDAALAATEGHQGKAAERLGLSYNQLRTLLRRHGYGKLPGRTKAEDAEADADGTA